MKISVHLFSITEQLSSILQGCEISVTDSFQAVNACIMTLQTDNEFEQSFKHAKSEASSLCEQPVLPRIR